MTLTTHWLSLAWSWLASWFHARPATRTPARDDASELTDEQRAALAFITEEGWES